MPSVISHLDDRTAVSKAETAFREAFERLKRNRPETLVKNSVVSQNNVAGTQVWSRKFSYGLRPIDLKHRSPPAKPEYCSASVTDP